MGASPAGTIEGAQVLTNDSIDQVRKFILRNEGLGGEMLIGASSLNEDLADLITRVERVRTLCGRFSDVELSPFVRRMVELADKHRLAV